MKVIGSISARMAIAFFGAAALVGCAEENTGNENQEAQEEIQVQSDNAVASNMMKLEGEIFSIPSPVQTAILFRKMKVPYQDELLNSPDAREKYTTRAAKALNLGVYGADLAYLSNYNNNQQKILYFKAIESLSNDLNIRNQIDQAVLDRFAKYVDIPDSLHAVNAELFSAGDRYLKENKEDATATLILAGGWIEGMHIALSAAKTNMALMSRIGEQQSAINSIIALLNKMDDPMKDTLLPQFEELKAVYQELEMTYNFVKPITDTKEKVTYLNSKSEVKMTEEQFAAIQSKVQEIRNIITQ
ncbi:MAG: hypothetical protein P8H98_06735 [Flavobacteriales bacterium]|nr:hypothetical protein [Flavobacteriales bacterium]